MCWRLEGGGVRACAVALGGEADLTLVPHPLQYRSRLRPRQSRTRSGSRPGSTWRRGRKWCCLTARYSPTLEATQVQILSQSPTDATRFWCHLCGSRLKKPSICPWVVSRVVPTSAPGFGFRVYGPGFRVSGVGSRSEVQGKVADSSSLLLSSLELSDTKVYEP